MDQQQKFIFDLTAQIEDCMHDADFDLGPDSVLYEKLKELKAFVEEYEENLP